MDDGGEDGSWGVILAVTLGVIALIMIIMLFSPLFRQSPEEVKEGLCRSSITLHSVTKYATAGELDADIACEPTRIRIRASEQEEAKHALGQAMLGCRDRWYRDYYAEDGFELFSENGTYCNPCSFVDFVSAPDHLENFPQFLFETPVRGSDLSYAQHLSMLGSEFAEGNVPEIAPETFGESRLPTNIDYAVLFVYAKGEASVGKLKEQFSRAPIEGAKEVGTGALWGAGAAGGTLLVIGVATSWTPAGWVILGSLAIGAAVGGVTTYQTSDFPLPQHLMQIQLIQNTPEAFLNSGCNYIEQEGARQPGPQDA